jgi:hypothetical protein
MSGHDVFSPEPLVCEFESSAVDGFFHKGNDLGELCDLIRTIIADEAEEER